MVSLDGLTKRFGPLVAVDRVSFTVGRGEVVGFLGPNGAGKTTTMRMVTGFVAPTAGTAKILGHDVVTQPIEAKRRIGYLPEGAPLYGDMAVRSFLEFIADMRGLTGDRKRQRLGEAVARTGLEKVLHQPIETLSKGYKRRVGLAQAILHDPPVLILDEPTDGLDPNQKFEVRKLITEMAPDKAIIVSTHILEEVDAVCSRAIIIARGRVIADETPEALRRRSPWHNALRLTVGGDGADGFEELLQGLNRVREVRRTTEVDGIVEFLVAPANGTDIAPEILALARERGLTIHGASIEQGRLEEVFRQLTTAS